MTTITCYVLNEFLQEKHEESIADCTEGICDYVNSLFKYALLFCMMEFVG